jgi:hypothetical protein
MISLARLCWAAVSFYCKSVVPTSVISLTGNVLHSNELITISPGGVVLDCLEKELGVPLDKALGTKRQLVMMMLYKYAGLKNHEIGLLYNCDYSTVSQARKRLLRKAEKDKVLQRRIGATEDTLSKIKI